MGQTGAKLCGSGLQWCRDDRQQAVSRQHHRGAILDDDTAVNQLEQAPLTPSLQLVFCKPHIITVNVNKFATFAMLNV